MNRQNDSLLPGAKHYENKNINGQYSANWVTTLFGSLQLSHTFSAQSPNHLGLETTPVLQVRPTCRTECSRPTSDLARLSGPGPRRAALSPATSAGGVGGAGVDRGPEEVWAEAAAGGGSGQEAGADAAMGSAGGDLGRSIRLRSGRREAWRSAGEDLEARCKPSEWAQQGEAQRAPSSRLTGGGFVTGTGDPVTLF